MIALETRQMPSLIVYAGYFSPTAGQVYSGNIGGIEDSNGPQAPSEYSATINWGDGSGTQNAAVYLQYGNLAIVGMHTYTQAGTYTITVSATGDGGSGSENRNITVATGTTTASFAASNSPLTLYTSVASTGGLPVTASLTTGGVQESVPLENGATECGCTDPGLELTYDGDSVAADQTLQWSDGTPSSSTLPSTIDAQLTFNGSAQATVTYGTTGDSVGDVLIGDIQTASAVTASGAYSWSITLTPSVGSPTTITGTAYIDVSTASEGVTAGNGWTFSGVSRLISTTGGVEWKDGEGLGSFFASSGGGGMGGGGLGGGGLGGGGGGTVTFTSPPGDYGTLTQNSSTNVYTYVAKGGQYTIYFNSSGYETGKVTADGQATTFTYSGSELTGIATPDGRFVTFTYDGSGNVQTAQMPNGTATFTHDGSGNLTVIERPDGSINSFTYDSNGRMTSEQTAGGTTTFSYNSHGMLHEITDGLGNNSYLAPQLSQGFSNAANITTAAAVVTNALSQPTTVMLDSGGKP